MAVIVQLANYVTPTSGGLKTSLNSLARAWAELGHTVHTIQPGVRSSSVRQGALCVHEVAGRRVPGAGGYRVIVGRGTVRRILEGVRPDVVFLSDRTTLLWTADWAREQGIPTALIAHERVDGVLRAFVPGIPVQRMSDTWNRRTAGRVDAVVCTTSFAAGEFDRIAIPVKRAPLGVDLDLFCPELRSGSLRRRFAARTLLGLFSRLSPEKCPEFALEVLREHRRFDPSVHLIVGGDGPLRPRMEEAARGLPVTFLGYVSDRRELATVLASMDVVLAPGPIETFGLAALEALACGTPVIANAESGLSEVIGIDGGQALQLDAEAWARTAARLAIAGSTQRQAARRQADRYPWSSSAQALLEVHGLTVLGRASA
jgi:alpha-1,6-mannosyltransferase